MGVDHLGGLLSIDDLLRQVRQIAVATIQNGAIGRAGIRVYDGGWIRIEGGGLSVTGSGDVSGTLNVTGQLDGDGVLVWTGPWTLAGDGTISGDVDVSGLLDVTGPTIVRGTLNVSGNSAFGGTLDILGATTIDGDVTLNSDLALGSGRIIAGSIVIDKNGGYGGRLTASTLLFDSGASRFTGTVIANGISSLGDISANGDLSVLGNSTVLGTKSFRMPHPLKDEHWLQHGCTESPISGTEYTGRATIGDDGSATVELPEYFEALNKPRNRTVQVTAIGRPFAVGAEEVIDGKVTVYGDPGRDVFWLVKAERTGGDFETEAAIPAAPVSYD